MIVNSGKCCFFWKDNTSLVKRHHQIFLPPRVKNKNKNCLRFCVGLQVGQPCIKLLKKNVCVAHRKRILLLQKMLEDKKNSWLG